MSGFYENITVSAAVPNAAADAEAAKDAAIVARDQAVLAKDQAQGFKQDSYTNSSNSLHYALQSLQNKSQAEGFANDAEDYKNTALSARNAAQSAQQSAQGFRDEANTIVNSVSANVATVANMADKIDAVANNDFRINTVYTDLVATGYTASVAADLRNQNRIGTVASNMSDVITVASNITDMATVAASLNSSHSISLVAGIGHTTLTTVASLRVDIQNVASNEQNITTVANSITASNSIDTVGANIYSVNAVANSIQDIQQVGNALSDIAAVENKLTEIDNVSDSITAVETVAGDVYKANVETVASISDDVTNLSKSTGNMATLVSKLGQTTDLAGAVTDAQNSATSAASSASTASTHATTASGHASTAATHAANLGSVAYQDLTAIAETKAVTATDVFVYDTSKDSDGGAWRNRTQGTSWYNEPLNTSNRGATKKFPAVAVIVAETNQVTIYDGDDPSLPMWMVFNCSGDTGSILMGNSRDLTSVAMLNAKLVLTAKGTSNGQTYFIDFIKDSALRNVSESSPFSALVAIADRNSAITRGVFGLYTLVSSYSNDVAMTALPNAPIDPDTGLPVPTIAVATDGGVSVIKDDGSVVNITGQVSGPKLIQFNNNNEIVTQENYHERLVVFPIPEEDVSTNNVIGARKYERHGNDGVRLSHWSIWNSIVDCETNKIALGCSKGLNQLHENPRNKHTGIVNYITSDYNTGWMNLVHTRLATLMDTTAETISAPELVTNGDFSSFGSDLVSNGDFSNGTTDWSTNQTTEALQVVNGKLRVTEDGVADPNVARAWQMITTEIGKTYKVTADIDPANTTTCALNISNSVSTSQSINVQTSGTATTAEFYFIAESTSTYVLLTVNSANTVGSYADFDNVTVKEITGWKAPVANSEVTLSNGQLTFMSGQASNSYVNQDLSGGGANPLVVGKTYAVSFNLISEVGTGLPYVRLGGDDVASIGSYGIGQNTIYFKYDGGSADLRFMTYAQDNVGFTIDNVSVTEVVADRSVNNNGLNIVGNVTKSAVATGAELVGYKFDSDSHKLVMPNATAVGDPTIDYCWMWWQRGTDMLFGTSAVTQWQSGVNYNPTTAGYYFSFGGSTGSKILRVSRVDNSLNVSTVDLSTTGLDSDLSLNDYNYFCVVKKGQNIYSYVNGKLRHSAFNNTIIGELETTQGGAFGLYESGNGDQGRMALFRVSATAPTAEQIAKIYRDEKPLFQEGAKCTLYGDSDNVEAIAYDDGHRDTSCRNFRRW